MGLSFLTLDQSYTRPPLGPFHTTPEEFENTALFPRLDLPSTLIRHENGAFRKRSSNRRNLKTPALRFSVNGKYFEKRSCSKTTTSPYKCEFPDRVFVKHKSKMTDYCFVFKFLRRSVDRKHLMRFYSETTVFKLLRCSVDAVLETQATGGCSQ